MISILLFIVTQHLADFPCDCNGIVKSREPWLPLFHKLRVSPERAQSPENLLCVIKTHHKEHASRAVNVLHTWARRCNTSVFVSDKDDGMLPRVEVLNFEGGEQYKNLWQKTRAIIKMLVSDTYKHFQWVFYCDTDTYVIVENLRAFIKKFQGIKRGVYAGHRLKFAGNINDIYNSGGAGVLINRAAIVAAYKNLKTRACNRTGSGLAEDHELGGCLASLGVHAEVTDTSCGHYFHMFDPQTVIDSSKYPGWTRSYSFEIENGPACCSPESISFHYMNARKSHDIDCLLYACR